MKRFVLIVVVIMVTSLVVALGAVIFSAKACPPTEVPPTATATTSPTATFTATEEITPTATATELLTPTATATELLTLTATLTATTEEITPEVPPTATVIYAPPVNPTPTEPQLGGGKPAGSIAVLILIPLVVVGLIFFVIKLNRHGKI